MSLTTSRRGFPGSFTATNKRVSLITIFWGDITFLAVTAARSFTRGLRWRFGKLRGAGWCVLLLWRWQIQLRLWAERQPVQLFTQRNREPLSMGKQLEQTNGQSHHQVGRRYTPRANHPHR